MPVLTPDEVRLYIKDYTENNELLDGQEFSDMEISFAIDLAISEYNLIPPLSVNTVEDFPNKALLMSGALYKMFAGRCALLARNTLNYTDGGLTVPVEERMPLYQTLASMFEQNFKSTAAQLKIHLNMESGWGEIYSDYSTFPLY
jgi:hypothetical protein